MKMVSIIGLTIRKINDTTCSILISKKSICDYLFKFQDEMKKHNKLYAHEESSRNLKCKFDGSIDEAQDIITEINRSLVIT